MEPNVMVHPLTPDRWDDFERFFGPHGAYGGCWCMWWRTTRKEFEAQKGEGNRTAMKAIVDSGRVPGLLAYVEGEPAAWCSVAPRSEFGSLNRSHVLKPLDDRPVWSIVCFYVAKAHRRQGLLVALISAAVDYVCAQGGTTVEAYPSIPRSGDVTPVTSFMGFPAVFEQAGFVEVARPSKSKCIMRYRIES